MYSQRMQILITPEQRRRLEDESRSTGVSVAALVRAALDARYGSGPTREERMAAAEYLTTGGTAEHIPIEELNELIDSRFDDEMERIEAQRR